MYSMYVEKNSFKYYGILSQHLNALFMAHVKIGFNCLKFPSPNSLI